MIFFVSVGELTLYSNIHVHVLDCITNALNLWHIAIFPALPNYIMICRHCITTGKSWWAFKKFTATLSNLLLDWKVTWPYGSRVAYEWMNSINTQGDLTRVVGWQTVYRNHYGFQENSRGGCRQATEILQNGRRLDIRKEIGEFSLHV